MDEIEYVFGTGDGVVHVWSSQADLDLARTGVPDAVRLDFDGDGLADDALWDSSGSGVADIAALDLDDDGLLDHFYTDPTGQGLWNHHITGAAADASAEPLDWIVRTGPLPDTSSETDDVLAKGLEDVLSEYPLRRPVFEGMEDSSHHAGAVPDQRGRLLGSADHPAAG
ncbi:hypothetical protein ACWEKT_04345 [Nocardia takedensis]|uniref:hypothetical protein n=1 Tax=Nocardia takedensis TaxID=259390 RepID=UPI00030229FC|nr:hypothetical protein [Nocardia takedensis]